MPGMDTSNDLEVELKPESGKAVIEGKTAVPFQSLVTLILQRKVQLLFKEWGKSPVIVSSELLTGLASAPQDSQQNTAHVVYVSLGVGILAGIAAFAILLVLLDLAQIIVSRRDLLIIAGAILGLGILAFALMKAQRRKKSEKVVESMEKLSSFLSGK
jgi:hypothetical protein